MKTLLIALFILTMAIPAMAATPTLNVSWNYSEFEGLTGFTLYKDGIEVCSTNDPEARKFTCTTEIKNRDYNFTMTAKATYNRESEHSEAYLYTPPAELFTPVDPPSGVTITTVNVTVSVTVK